MFPSCANKCHRAIEDRFEAFFGGGVCKAALEGLPYVLPEDMWVVEATKELRCGFIGEAALTKTEARRKAAQEMRGTPGERHLWSLWS